MARAWMPEAERLGADTTPAPAGIGAPRAVWTVTGSDPRAWSAREEALRMLDGGRTSHLVWNPLTGEVAQTLAATRRGRLELGCTRLNGVRLDHGHEGRVCLVVAVVASPEEPFTDGPMCGLEPILAWLDSWGIARVWPAGRPGTGSRTTEGGARLWARGGHFGHDQVPGSCSKGPGRLDTARLLGRTPLTDETLLHSTPPRPRPSAIG